MAEQGFSIDDEIDAYDARAEGVHMLLNVLLEEEGGEVKKVPAGVVRIITSKNKVRLLASFHPSTLQGAVLTITEHQQLGRLAILPPYRKYGFGRVLVQGVHDWARSQLKGPDEKVQVVLHAQVSLLALCLSILLADGECRRYMRFHFIRSAGITQRESRLRKMAVSPSRSELVVC